MESFMKGPLLEWLRTFPDVPKDVTFQDLTAGNFLHRILQTFESRRNSQQHDEYDDANPICNGDSGGVAETRVVVADYKSKVQNLENLIRNLKYYYEEILGQSVVIALPNSLIICQEPVTQASLEEMDKLLLLFLGAAVQCSEKDRIIASIQSLPDHIQHAFVEKIKKLTQNPEHIWTSELNNPLGMEPDHKNAMYALLVTHLKRLVKERDDLSHQVVEITLSSTASSAEDDNDKHVSAKVTHLSLEVAEYKTKIRKLNQLLEEKTECLSECREENDEYAVKVQKLKQENLQLTQEARAAKGFRDELDILRERAMKVDKLESEIQRYKDKINDNEFYKTRNEELREDNKILTETKEMLEQQLESARRRGNGIFELENELLKCKSEIASLQMEREDNQQRICDLLEENMSLRLNTKDSLSESQSLLAEIQSLKSHDKDTNIFAEQLGKDVTRIHKLELENQRLKSELEEMKVNRFHEHADRILDLERENKKYSLTIKQLEERLSKETEQCDRLEKDVLRLNDKNKQYEQIVKTLEENEQSTIVEKDAVIENLTKQVDSLRRRQEESQNEQVSHLHEENLRLVKDTTLLQSRVAQLKREKEQLASRYKELSQGMESFEELKMEKEQMESRVKELTKETETLKSLQEANDNLIFEKEKLDQKCNSFSKIIEKLKSDKEEISRDKSNLNGEVSKLKQKLENLSRENRTIAELEQEKESLRLNATQLNTKIKDMQKTVRVYDELELKITTTTGELTRLQRQHSTLSYKYEELDAENKRLEEENRKLTKTMEHLRVTARKVEQLEKDNVTLETENHRMDKKFTSLSKEVGRLKASIEAKEATIEEVTSDLTALKIEKERLSRDFKLLKESSSKLKELEQENRTLNQTCAVDKRAIVTLREELVQEKMKGDALSSKLELLEKQLQKLGLDREALSNGDFIDILSRVMNLEGSLMTLVETRDRKITSLEARVKEIEEQKNGLLKEIELLQIKAQGGDAKSEIENELTKVLKEKEKMEAELLDLRMKVSALDDKVELYKREKKRVNEELHKLTEDRASVQVENTTLQSQSALLLGQINILQSSNSQMEAEKAKFKMIENAMKSEKEDLLRDQDRLQKLYDNLQVDYDKLLKEKDAQKETEKALRSELRKLQALSLSLSEGQDELIRAKEAIDREREVLRTDARTLSNLRAEHACLKEDFRCLFTVDERIKKEYCNLQTDYKALKTAHNQLKLTHTELQGLLGETKEKNVILDVDNAKLANRCEVLQRLNESLEEDRKSLMGQVEILLTQYHELLTQTLEDKDHFHEEEKFFTDRVNNLARQKEKLEEKIFEQYKRMENTPKKGGFGSVFVQKMRKASSHLLLTGNKSRVPITNESGGGGGGSGMTILAGSGGLLSVPRSLRGPRPRPIVEDDNDSSSLGSGGNDSLDSGQHSPNSGGGVVGVGAENESIKVIRKIVSQRSFNNSEVGSTSGINIDDDSVSIVSGNSHIVPGHHLATNNFYSDEIPTRDIAPERLINQGFSSSHSEVGIPIITADNRSTRSLSSNRYYDNDHSSSDRSSTPRLASWKSSNSSPAPSNGSQEDEAPPIVPRKPSKDQTTEPPPKLPPKPGNGNRRVQLDANANSGASSSLPLNNELLDEEENTTSSSGEGGGSISEKSTADVAVAAAAKKNEEWYEYGCV